MLPRCRLRYMPQAHFRPASFHACVCCLACPLVRPSRVVGLDHIGRAQPRPEASVYGAGAAHRAALLSTRWLPAPGSRPLLQVPQLYKRLRYPFQISKSNLSAVGSPHTWPSLLAALTWLVELLNYQEKAEAARQVSARGSREAHVARPCKHHTALCCELELALEFAREGCS